MRIYSAKIAKPEILSATKTLTKQECDEKVYASLYKHSVIGQSRLTGKSMGICLKRYLVRAVYFLGNLTGQLENGMVKNAEGVSFEKPLIKEYAAKRSATYVGIGIVSSLNLEERSTAAAESFYTPSRMVISSAFVASSYITIIVDEGFS